MSTLVYLVGVAVIVMVSIAVAAPLFGGGGRRLVVRGADPERRRLEKEKELAYGAIKEAEFDFQMGKLSPEDYATLRGKYETRALRALEALETIEGTS